MVYHEFIVSAVFIWMCLTWVLSKIFKHTVIKPKLPYHEGHIFAGMFTAALLVYFSSSHEQSTIKEWVDVDKVRIYSTNTPTLSTQGGGIMSFGYGTIRIGSEVGYIVRTKVGAGYKDILVQDSILQEDLSLNNSGVYEVKSSCKTVVNSVTLIFKNHTWTEDLCEVKSKTIFVPVGSISFNMNI